MVAKDQCHRCAENQNQKETLSKKAQAQDIKQKAESILGRSLKLVSYIEIHFFSDFDTI